MVASLKTDGKVERPPIYRINVRDLQDKKLTEKLDGLWERLNAELQVEGAKVEGTFLKGLYKSKHITRTHGKKKARLRKQKERELREKLKAAQILLEVDPQCLDSQALLLEVEEEVKR